MKMKVLKSLFAWSLIALFVLVAAQAPEPVPSIVIGGVSLATTFMLLLQFVKYAQKLFPNWVPPDGLFLWLAVGMDVVGYILLKVVIPLAGWTEALVGGYLTMANGILGDMLAIVALLPLTLLARVVTKNVVAPFLARSAS